MIGSVSGAYALTNDIGLIAALSYSPIGQQDSSGAGSFYSEAGAGYHKNYGEHGRAEFYGGLGYGHVDNRSLWSGQRSFEPIPGVINSMEFSEEKADYLRPFLQLNAGGEGSTMGFGVSVRATYLIVERIDTRYTDWDNSYPDSLGKSTKLNVMNSFRPFTRSVFFIEPAMMFRVGHAPLKLEAKAWGSVAPGSPLFVWTGINGSLGVSLALDP